MKDRQTYQSVTERYGSAARNDCSVLGGDDVINLLASSMQIAEQICYDIKKWHRIITSSVIPAMKYRKVYQNEVF